MSEIEEKIENNKWLFKQFTEINITAKAVYGAVQGGVGLNFYSCYKEYENGVFGWVKESNSFQFALDIYEQYTSNDAWDIIYQLEDEFGEQLKLFTWDEIVEWNKKLEDIK